ncbi:hypothetical protein KJ853_01645 [Patescibacteria group bacterium]|nr:hypothetical protein [Patescibacteria group bacterium]
MEQEINQFNSPPKKYFTFLPIIIAVILTAVIVGCGIYWWVGRKQAILNNEITFLRTQLDQYKTASTQIPNQTTNRCGAISDFEKEEWFSKAVELYKTKYPKEYQEGIDISGDKFYADYPELHQMKACLTSNYFVFMPWSNIGLEGAIFSYNIEKNNLTKSPSNQFSYPIFELSEINNDYVLFKGAGGSGDCGGEEYGEYFYKDGENFVYINKVCGGCIDQEYTCQEVNKVFK